MKLRTIQSFDHRPFYQRQDAMRNEALRGQIYMRACVLVQAILWLSYLFPRPLLYIFTMGAPSNWFYLQGYVFSLFLYFLVLSNLEWDQKRGSQLMMITLGMQFLLEVPIGMKLLLF
jgi:hypothetical protein